MLSIVMHHEPKKEEEKYTHVVHASDSSCDACYVAKKKKTKGPKSQKVKRARDKKGE